MSNTYLTFIIKTDEYYLPDGLMDRVKVREFETGARPKRDPPSSGLTSIRQSIRSIGRSAPSLRPSVETGLRGDDIHAVGSSVFRFGSQPYSPSSSGSPVDRESHSA